MKRHILDLADKVRGMGGQDVTVEDRKTHARIYYTFNGRRRFHVCPVSPSDWRWMHNALSGIRRDMGVTNARQKSARSKKPKARQKVVPVLSSSLTTGTDWTAVLKQHGQYEAAMRRRLDNLWLSWFRSFYRGS